MKRETVRRLGGFALAAVLATASVQPVLAEEPNPEAQNTEAAVQTAEQESAADVERAEKKKPSVTVDSVDWNGDKLKVPVDLGDYSAEEVEITCERRRGGTGWSIGLDYENGYAVGTVIDYMRLSLDKNSSFYDNWYTKAGDYEQIISFVDKKQNVIAKENVTVHVLEDSVEWQIQEENYVFDGSQDVIFKIKNGTNIFEIQSLEKKLSIFTGKAATWEPSVSVPDMTDGFTYDLEAGTLTINKEALAKTLASATSRNGGVMPNKISISVHAIMPNGGSYRKGAWLDISKWNDAQNETPSEMTFGDVAADHWYYDYVKYVYDRGLMTGLNENDFGAVQSLARAQFAVILYRMEGEPKVEYKDVFPDVADGQWYTDAIMWANQAGIVTGYEDSGLFGFADDINREQMAVMMHRYAEYKGFDISKKADFNAFSDAASVNEFADEAMQWAVGTGIISGKDEGTRIDPQGDAARAECATIIQRFVTAYGM